MARGDRPKQFLAFDGGKTLFEQACRRAVAVATRERVLVVCGRDHLAWVRRQAPWIPARRIILESIGRNTAASVALAAHWIVRHAGDGTMVVLSSDHRIAPLAAFVRDVRRAVRSAGRSEALVIMGVPATRPDTGYGYIKPAARLLGREPVPVRAFVEKPAPVLARRMVARGDVLWNCGMFVWRASGILTELRRHAPRLARAVARAVPTRGAAPWRISVRAMSRIDALPIDKAVLERSPGVRVLKASFAWSDLGNWDSVGSILRHDAGDNRFAGGLVVLDSDRCVSVNPGGITVLIDVHDLVVVRDGGAILVSPRASVQRVREAQQLLRTRSLRPAIARGERVL
jgi:mannose-1-phosphate guanylyltransferase/mannose-6-phosphate isomerase